MSKNRAALPQNGLPSPITQEIKNLILLDESAEAMLRRNGFVVLESRGEINLCDAYPHYGAPSHLFVTSDAVLALWYALHLRIQQDMEQNVLAPKLVEAISELASMSIELLAKAQDSIERQSLTRVAIILLTAANLVEIESDAPDYLMAAARNEALSIRDHSVNEPYPGEDYTQYTVRGYYTDTPQLSRYFQAAMYLSRRFWPVESSHHKFAFDPLHDAVTMAAVVRVAPAARSAIAQMNATRSALFGSPNAISIEQIIQALDRLFQPDWTLTHAISEDATVALRRELAASEYPKAQVHTRSIWPDQDFPDRIVSLIPDIALPDSVAFQVTVNPAIEDRSLPSGVEVAAALGFGQAGQILADEPHGEKIAAVVENASPTYTAGDNCVGYWYRALSALSKTDPRAPAFMQSAVWEAKQTSTALSSWAQLRHNAILAASQTYARLACIVEPPPAIVEANPAFFDAMAYLSDRLSEKLIENGGIGQRSSSDLTEFTNECRLFSQAAAHQLEGRLAEDLSNRVSKFGEWLEKFDIQTGPVIADVATGEYGEVLHAAAGMFRPIIVIPDPDHPTAYYGWTQSYYEIVCRNGERLTDEAWEKMSSAKYAVPQRPSWTSLFVAPLDGPAWVAREGLRNAEQLFLDGKDEDAIKALRGVVEEKRSTDVSTEAQLQIGKYYLDHSDTETAYRELLNCRSLPGGSSYNEARHLLLSVLRDMPHHALADEPASVAPRAGMIDELARFALKDPQQLEMERAQALWGEGKLEDAVALYRALCRPDEHELGPMKFRVEEFERYDDFDHEPLRLRVAADILSNANPSKAAAIYEEIYRRYPMSKLALPGLWQALEHYGIAFDFQDVTRVRSLLQDAFPETPEALVLLAEDMYHMGDAVSALSILGRIMEEVRQTGAVSQPAYVASRLEWKVSRDVALRPMLTRFAEAGGLEAPARDIGSDYAIAVVMEYIQRNPSQAADVINFLIDAYRNSKYELAMPILAAAPATEAVATLRTKYRQEMGERLPGLFQQALEWIVLALESSGPTFQDAEEALRICLGVSQSSSARGSFGLSTIVHRATHILERYPRTSVASLAASIAAEGMLANSQPEEALAILMDDRVGARKLSQFKIIRKRAEMEIAAKLTRPWHPVWTLDMQVHMSFIPRHRDSAPVPVEAGQILAATYDTYFEGAGLIGLDIAGGEERWRLSLGVVSGLALTEAGRLCAAAGGEIFWINHETGEIDFASAMDEGSLANAEFNPPGEISLSPAGDVIVAVEANAWLAGFDANTGERLWRKSWMVCRGGAGMSHPPAVIGETVFVTTNDSVVHALNAVSGEEIWERSFAKEQSDERSGHRRWLEPVGSNPIALHDSRLIVDERDELYLLDAATGEIIATYKPPTNSKISAALFAGSASFIIKWLDQGAAGWSPLSPFIHILTAYQVNAKLIPAFDEARAYFLQDGCACAMDLVAGATLAWYPVESSRLNLVALGKNNVYFCTVEGKVTAMPRLN